MGDKSCLTDLSVCLYGQPLLCGRRMLNQLRRALEQHRLCSSAFTRWREVLALRKRMRHMTRAADRRRVRATKSHTLAKWKARFKQTQSLSTLVPYFQERWDDNQRRQAFDNWRTYMRISVMGRALDLHVVKKSWKTWRAQYAGRLAARSHAWEVIRHSNQQRVKLQALIRWREKATRFREQGKLVAHEADNKLQRWAWGRFQARTHTLWINQAGADQAYRGIVLHQTFSWWREARLGHLGRVWQDKKDVQLLSSVWGDWTRMIERSRRDRLISDIVAQREKARLVHHAWERWKTHVMELHTRFWQVGLERDQSLSVWAWNSWRSAHADQKRREALLVSALAVKKDALKRRVWRTWHVRAMQSRSRKDRLETFTTQKNLLLMTSVLSRWYDLTQEGLMWPSEYQVTVHSQTQLLKRMFEHWMTKCYALPALELRNKKLKLRAWRAWLEALPLAHDQHEADNVDKEMLLAQALHIWRHAAKQRATFRAAARFGGLSAHRLRAMSSRLRVPSSRFSTPPGSRGNSSSSPFPAGTSGTSHSTQLRPHAILIRRPSSRYGDTPQTDRESMAFQAERDVSSPLLRRVHTSLPNGHDNSSPTVPDGAEEEQSGQEQEQVSEVESEREPDENEAKGEQVLEDTHKETSIIVSHPDQNRSPLLGRGPRHSPRSESGGVFRGDGGSSFRDLTADLPLGSARTSLSPFTPRPELVRSSTPPPPRTTPQQKFQREPRTDIRTRHERLLERWRSRE